MARGLQRRHMKGSCRAHHTLSVDLAGPHPPALGTGATYGLVGVYMVDLGENLPFVVGVKTNNAEECAYGILKIIKMVTWMSDGGLILRLHSDEGGEFWNKLMEKLQIC